MPDIRLSVNIALRQLRDSRFVEWLLERLVLADLPCDRLTLEIPEATLHETHGAIYDNVCRAGASGLSLGLDDFATGPTSLQTLRQQGVTAIHISRLFIHDIARDPNAACLVDAMIAMARSLNLVVIAKGIESKDVACLLQSQGCKFAQGYLFDEPMTAEALATRLKRQQDSGATASAPANLGKV